MSESKNKEQSLNVEQNKNNLAKRNSLIENNRIAEWANDVLIVEMDKFVFVRTMVIFLSCFFFLGNSLNIYLYLFIGITAWMLVLRLIRWWVKRWLLYLWEFCYFGIVGFIIYLLFFPTSKEFYITTFVYSSGNMALAAIIFNNAAQFTSTDHISSAWLHGAPFITSYAIRWMHIIYSDVSITRLDFKLLSQKDMEITNDQIPMLFIVYPLAFWAIWLVYYLFFFYLCCHSQIESNKASGLEDFKKFKHLKPIFGSLESGTRWKYLLMHFVMYAIGIPLAILSYKYFIAHTIYIVIVLLYLFYNAGKQQDSFINKKVRERLQAEGLLINENAC